MKSTLKLPSRAHMLRRQKVGLSLPKGSLTRPVEAFERAFPIVPYLPSPPLRCFCVLFLDSSADESKWERHYEEWDRGAIDYTGRDAFENIQKQFEKALNE
uniref:Uncharacterized protein n=1 Tax=Bursaphelenchus xylophilus TaxID=6326 RepID=A0A1I7RR08_BURXY